LSIFLWGEGGVEGWGGEFSRESTKCCREKEEARESFFRKCRVRGNEPTWIDLARERETSGRGRKSEGCCRRGKIFRSQERRTLRDSRSDQGERKKRPGGEKDDHSGNLTPEGGVEASELLAARESGERGENRFEMNLRSRRGLFSRVNGDRKGLEGRRNQLCPSQKKRGGNPLRGERASGNARKRHTNHYRGKGRINLSRLAVSKGKGQTSREEEEQERKGAFCAIRGLSSHEFGGEELA